MKEAFWRTMLNDSLEPEPNKHEQLTAEYETLFVWWWKILKDGYAQVLDSVILPGLDPVTLRRAMTAPGEFSHSLQARLRVVARSFWLPNDNRAFFPTQQGYMGFGPPDMKQGDLVAVLLGSRLPFILRQAPPPAIVGGSEGIHDKRYYSVVGYCYLHGVMKNGAVCENTNICDINLV